jgi:hypothetical protein
VTALLRQVLCGRRAAASVQQQRISWPKRNSCGWTRREEDGRRGMQWSAVRFVGEVRRSRGGPQLLHTHCWIIERGCCRVRWSGERVVILSPVLRCVQSRGKWSVTASPRNHTTTPALSFPHHSPPCCSGGRVTKPLRARTYRHTPPFLHFGESVDCW